MIEAIAISLGFNVEVKNSILQVRKHAQNYINI